MRRSFTLLLSGALLAQQLDAQARNIPVRSVAAPVLSTERFGTQPVVRHLPDGRVLVNDTRGKRLIVFDSTLSRFTISADSNATNGTSYPAASLRTPLIPYLGDSTLFIDFTARTFLVINPDGQVGRAMSHAKATDFTATSVPYAGTPSTDNQGRLIYRATLGRPEPRPGEPPITATRDTINIVRADFNLRTVDTIASFGAPQFLRPVITDHPNGKPTSTLKVNPIPGVPDEWAVMSDGTLAIVREHDYHVDWVTPDGSKYSTPKMPYDWKRLTDDDKVARIDSMKKVIDSVNATGRPYFMTVRGTRQRSDTIIPVVSFAPLNEIPDYVAPIRQGSVKADMDGNLWGRTRALR